MPIRQNRHERGANDALKVIFVTYVTFETVVVLLTVVTVMTIVSQVQRRKTSWRAIFHRIQLFILSKNSRSLPA